MISKTNFTLIGIMVILMLTFAVSQIITPGSTPTFNAFKNESDYTEVEILECIGDKYFINGDLFCEEGWRTINVTDYGERGGLTQTEEIKLLRQAIFELNDRLTKLEQQK